MKWPLPRCAMAVTERMEKVRAVISESAWGLRGALGAQ